MILEHFFKGGEVMKNLIFLLAFLVLFGCAHNPISQFERKYGPSAKVERLGNETSYYFYVKTRGSVPAGAFGPYPSPGIQAYAEGWRLHVITTNPAGEIIDERSFWRIPHGGR